MKKIFLLASLLIFTRISFSQFIGTGSSSYHTIAVKANGTVYGWGANSSGQLGKGNYTQSNIPVAVSTSGVLLGKFITKVASGVTHSIALASDGTVYTWGANQYGQLGNGNNTASNVPVAVSTSGVLSGKTITQVACGKYFSVAVGSDGMVYTWGDNQNGELGNGNNTASNIPVAVSTSGVLSNKTITLVASGEHFSIALDSDGKVYTWGFNASGQLGNGNEINSNIPVAVSTSGALSGKTIKQITAGGYHTIVLDSDGKVYAWGGGDIGTATSDNTLPGAVITSGVLTGKTITKIASGWGLSIALDSDGKVYTWGDFNQYGQLGNGNNTASNVPVAVSSIGVINGKTITQIAAGFYYVVALANDGTVYTWGDNREGTLGNGNFTSSNVPVAANLSGIGGSLKTQITISSFSPTSGAIGATVTITGTDFNTTAADNIVWFGKVKATVTSATSTQLTVTVPIGAAAEPITVLNTQTHLLSQSAKPFIVTFVGGAISSTSMSSKVDFASGSKPRQITTGDLDGDGMIDIAITNDSSNTVSVYRNTSTSGSLTTSSLTSKVDFATGSNPRGITLGDIDGDGKLDMAVANSGSNTVSVYRNASTSGSFTTSSFTSKVDFTTESIPQGITLGDIDGDGKLDMAVTNSGSNLVSVYRNTSTSGSLTTSSFTSKVDFTTGSSPYGITLGDLDGDGKLDMAVTNDDDSSTVSVFRNTSTSGSLTTSSFTSKVDFTAGRFPEGVKLGDIDGDGKLDMIVLNFASYTISVYRNTSTSGSITASSFEAKVDFTTSTNPSGIELGDIDGDGKLDMVVSMFTSSYVFVYRNTATSGSLTTSSFAARKSFNTGNRTNGIALGDIDGDGKLDFAITGYNSNTISVLRNLGLTPPPVAVLVNPTSNKINVGVNETLKWRNVETATSYKLQMSLVSDFATQTKDTTTSDTTKYIYGMQSNTKYYWRVRGSNTSGDGPWKADSFTTVTAKYLITASSGPNGTIVPVGDTLITHGDSIQYTITANSGYRIDSVVIDGVQQWGGADPSLTLTWHKFKNVSASHTIRATFKIAAPTITSYTPKTAATGATVTIIGTKFTGTSAVSFGSTAATSFIIQAVNSTDADTILAIVGSGTTGTISITTPGGTATSSGIFKLDNEAPAKPTGLTTIAGNAQIKLVWLANTESDLAGYNVYGGTTANPTSLLATVLVPTTTYTHTGLTNGKSHHYRISAVDSAGNESNKTNVETEKPNDIPNQAVLVNPPTNTINVAVNVLFSWRKLEAATSYKLQMSLVSDFATQTKDTTTSDTTKYISGMQNHKKYYWRVRGINSSGDGPWSTDSFTTVKAKHLISASKVGSGTIIPIGDTLITEGDSVRYNMTANLGYKVDSVFIDGTQQWGGGTSPVTGHTFVNVTAPHTIKVVFGAWPGKVLLSTHAINFEIERVNYKRSRPITIKNIGGDTLKFTEWSSNSSDFIVNPLPTSAMIVPGLSHTDSIWFKPLSAGVKKGKIYITTNVGRDSISLEGTGIGEPILLLTPKQFDFGSVKVNSKNFLKYSLKNTGTDTMRMHEVFSTNRDNFSAIMPPIGIVLAPDHFYIDSILFNPLKVGTHMANIIFKGDRVEDSIFVKGIATGAAKLKLSVTKIDFGSVKQHLWKDTTFKIINEGDDVLKVKLRIDPPLVATNFTMNDPMQERVVLPGLSIVEPIKFTPNPMFLGAVNGTLNLTANTNPPNDSILLVANVVTKVPIGTEIPTTFTLSQNYPNPFNPSTTIRFGLPSESNVKLEIYNSLGQLVQVVLDERLGAHYYEAKWETGKIPSGLYFYKITATEINNTKNKFVQTMKMVLMK